MLFPSVRVVAFQARSAVPGRCCCVLPNKPVAGEGAAVPKFDDMELPNALLLPKAAAGAGAPNNDPAGAGAGTAPKLKLLVAGCA